MEVHFGVARMWYWLYLNFISNTENEYSVEKT